MNSLTLSPENLSDYLNRYPDSSEVVDQLRALISTQERAFFRDNFIISENFPNGHVTGSLLITNPERTHFLLMKHKSLGKLLQFWGHCDGDTDVLEVARRECLEEAGLTPEIFPQIVDIDIHEIPENSRKGEPMHHHYDIGFVWVLPMDTPIQADPNEVDTSNGAGIEWYSLEEVKKMTGARLVRYAERATVLK